MKINKKKILRNAQNDRDTKPVQNKEKGRSMTEMLGVLAVIGVLSVAGIIGYKSAMIKHKANNLLDEVSKRAVVVAGQLLIDATGENLSLNEFTDPIGYKFGIETDTNQFIVTLKTDSDEQIDSVVCDQINNILGEGHINPSVEDNCTGFVYNDDMAFDSNTLADDTDLDKECTKDEECKGPCEICSSSGYCVNKCPSDQECAVDGTTCLECSTEIFDGNCCPSDRFYWIDPWTPGCCSDGTYLDKNEYGCCPQPDQNYSLYMEKCCDDSEYSNFDGVDSCCPNKKFIIGWDNSVSCCSESTYPSRMHDICCDKPNMYTVAPAVWPYTNEDVGCCEHEDDYIASDGACCALTRMYSRGSDMYCCAENTYPSTGGDACCPQPNQYSDVDGNCCASVYMTYGSPIRCCLNNTYPSNGDDGCCPQPNQNLDKNGTCCDDSRYDSTANICG